MPRYHTPVRDWDCRVPAKFRRNKSQVMGIATLQQGVMMFTRKKKNGSRLLSGSMISHGTKLTQRKHKVFGHLAAFPPIPIV